MADSPFTFLGRLKLLQTSLSMVAFTLVIDSHFIHICLDDSHSTSGSPFYDTNLDVEIASETKYYGPNQYTKSIEHVTSSKIVLAQGVLPSSNWTTYPVFQLVSYERKEQGNFL